MLVRIQRKGELSFFPISSRFRQALLPLPVQPQKSPSSPGGSLRQGIQHKKITIRFPVNQADALQQISA